MSYFRKLLLRIAYAKPCAPHFLCKLHCIASNKYATRMFNDYKRLPRFAGRQVDHVDPEILACGLCGLYIDHFHLSKDGLTLGMTAFKEIGVEVYDDSGQPFFYYLDGRILLDVEKEDDD